MSSSVERVERALEQAGLVPRVRALAQSTRTAQEAATALGVVVDQIAKSIILEASDSQHLLLFITAGGNRVDLAKAAALVGGAVRQAKPEAIRQRTGFAIGGVAPVGHLEPLPTWMDQTLLSFACVWAAGGTPNHLFEIAPDRLAQIANATTADFAER
ncbi:YbaK/EbsC family protein [Pseudotabrizicola algicola]|uniref:YbaK/EbsC family protein n=1 Tax=Pseudotabrizicola algicola TaxID=2709381 RepID=A0A6B3RVL4_9RHOB|nr:YbaK/EbsC family protein [Pseudotabrizicola algicola]NEX47925.1 YbaK/EbsC family protein [Pseudotabrizicola algicola]